MMKKLFSLFAILFLGITILTSCSDSKGKPLIVACGVSTSPYCTAILAVFSEDSFLMAEPFGTTITWEDVS